MLTYTNDSFQWLYKAALEFFSVTNNFPMLLLYKADCFNKSLYRQVGVFFCHILSINKSESFLCLVKKLNCSPEDLRQAFIQRVRSQNVFRFHNYHQLIIPCIRTNMLLYTFEICQFQASACKMLLSFSSPIFSVPISCIVESR